MLKTQNLYLISISVLKAAINFLQRYALRPLFWVTIDHIQIGNFDSFKIMIIDYSARGEVNQ